MCQPNFNIQFCTCSATEKKEPEKIIHNKNSRRFKKKFDRDEYIQKKFTWHLSKYVETGYFGMDGMMLMPDEKLTNELTAEFLLDELNSNLNLFDFDYLPSEGDCLTVRPEYVYPEMKGRNRPSMMQYLSFIFRNDKWIQDIYNAFYDITEEIAQGIVKIDK